RDPLQNSKSLQDLPTVLSDPRILRDSELVSDAPQIPARPNAGMDHVSRLVHRVRYLRARWSGWDDADIEAVEPVLLEQVALEVARFFAQWACIGDRGVSDRRPDPGVKGKGEKHRAAHAREKSHISVGKISKLEVGDIARIHWRRPLRPQIGVRS